MIIDPSPGKHQGRERERLMPGRRFLRFSIRGLIVVVLVFGVTLGWFVRSVRIQREAVAAIVRDGGSVVYDWEWSDSGRKPSAKPPAPQWLVDSVGVDCFGRVVAADLAQYQTVSEGLIEQIGRLEHLKSLTVYAAFLTDAQLARLKGLTGITDLWLDGTQVTDSGLAHLKGLTKLNVFRSRTPQVSDAGLEHLKGLKSLSALYLSNTQVTDRGLEDLSGLSLWTSRSQPHCRSPMRARNIWRA